MNEKIQISDLIIDNYTAKDAMKRVVEYMNIEALNIVEMITLSTLGEVANQEELQRQISEFDITFAGDNAILQAAGVEDARRLRASEPLLFVKLAMHFLHKNRSRVFLLADNVNELQKLRQSVTEEYASIQIVGTATMEENGTSDDMILNLINGVEADCIISILPSPTQENFIIRNKSLLNARLWLGFGNWFEKIKTEHSFVGKIKKMLAKQILKREIAKKGGNA